MQDELSESKPVEPYIGADAELEVVVALVVLAVIGVCVVRVTAVTVVGVEIGICVVQLAIVIPVIDRLHLHREQAVCRCLDR